MYALLHLHHAACMFQIGCSTSGFRACLFSTADICDVTYEPRPDEDGSFVGLIRFASNKFLLIFLLELGAIDPHLVEVNGKRARAIKS